ncbi:MAG: helix-turn-helix domain-containing protein [Cytophagales bacterium]|nr:helix-turn-helix domain-containing protein [Cytophagales bacterium]
MTVKTICHIVFTFFLFTLKGSFLWAIDTPDSGKNLFDAFEKSEIKISSVRTESFSPALFFDGINSNIEINCPDAFSSSFSFCAWIKPESLLKKNMAIVGIPETFWFRTTTKRELQFTQPGIIDNNTEGLLLSNENWVFVCFVINYPDIRVYCNARLVGEFEWMGNKPRKWGDRLFMGKDHWRQHFHGFMHRMTIYDRAISPYEIESRYKADADDLTLSDGIVLYHPFDVKNEYYSMSNHFRSINTVYTEDSVRGKVARFNGESSYIDFGVIPIDNAVTVSTWIKPEVFDRDQGALAAFGHAFAFRFTSGGNLLFTIPQITDITDIPARLKLKQWQHVALTFREKEGVSFFINGKKTNFFPAGEYQNTVKDLKIGTNLWNDFYKGKMDDLIIWNRVLSDDELRLIYERPRKYRKPVSRHKAANTRTIFLIAGILIALSGTASLLIKKRGKTKAASGERSENPFLRKINAVVDQNLADSNFSVAGFADAMHMSKTKLYNELKSLTGKSPKEYIREQRLSKAARLLKESDLPVTEIVSETGFDSRAYFNKCFKQKFALTPTSYRNSST